MRAFEQIGSLIRINQVVKKTKAFCKWKEVVKDSSHISDPSIYPQ